MYKKLKKIITFGKSKSKNKEYFIIFILWPSGVPFYQLMIAFVLRFMNKEKVSIVIDKTNLSRNYFKENKISILIFNLSGFLMRLSASKIYIVNNTKNNLNFNDKEINKFFKDILTWKKNKNFNYQNKLSEEDLRSKKDYFFANSSIKKFIKIIDSSSKRDKIFLLPGGIVSTTRLWIHNIEKIKANYFTYEDGGKDRTLWARDGIAAQFPNAIEDLQDILNSDYSIINKNLKISEKVLEGRTKCKDIGETGIELSTFQKVSKSDELQITNIKSKFIITIFLNVSWDSASLGVETNFHSTFKMIENISQELLTINNIILIVRQHPIERDPIITTRDNYNLLERKLKNKYKDKFLFIKANDNFNSYELIEKSNIVISHSSTVGLEAAILGKPSITISKCYYHKLSGIIYCPDLNSIKETVIKIKNNKFKKASKKDIDSCKLVYFLTQYSYKRDTGFSPTMNIRRFFQLVKKPNTFIKMSRFFSIFF